MKPHYRLEYDPELHNCWWLWLGDKVMGFGHTPAEAIRSALINNRIIPA